MTIHRLTAPPQPALLDRLHALNQAHAEMLSDLTPARLSDLIAMAAFAATVDDGDGLLICFDQDADYDSPNFAWFKARYDRFFYVDRIVVSVSRQGEGLARALYEEAFAAARMAGHTMGAAEINYEPPNPASDAFHTRLGFDEVGREFVESYGKGIRYIARTL